MKTVHVVVPAGIDDPARPSGGNTYDRRICRGLADQGWSVHEHHVPGPWPREDRAARAALRGAVSALPDRATVLIDGLIASATPAVLVPEAERLRLAVLVHMPLGDGQGGEPLSAVCLRERAVLSAADAVVTTSAWTRQYVLDRYGLHARQVHVAEPGVDPAAVVPGTRAGGELLCVAAVTPAKGHDVLLAALASLTCVPWRCVCVGPLDRDPGLVARLGRQAHEAGVGERVCLVGPLTGAALDAAYAAADLLVLPSRAETYAMVVTEALARGLPVVASNVGGLPQALGHGADGRRPGLLVPPGDPGALAAALCSWLEDSSLRRRLRQVALERRQRLTDWSAPVARISAVLGEVAA